ncbi:MAG: TetR/AcrR family transcriptional regulator [Oscillospiraceae bacterium]|nr:TetR/AcrR family transcriptional regulator [Oscillospiraceae bacterium]
MADERLEKVLSSAAELFIKVGFRKASIAEISRESGVSIGTIYDYFENKVCVFYGILAQIANPDFYSHVTKLPLAQLDFANLENECTTVMTLFIQNFGAPLRQRNENYTYEQLLSDAFDSLAPFGKGCLLLQANPRICPLVYNGFNKLRVKMTKLVDGYLRFFQARGVVRPLSRTDVHARFLLESIYWWGSMVHYEEYDPANRRIPRGVAKEVCTKALYNAYAVTQV